MFRLRDWFNSSLLDDAITSMVEKYNAVIDISQVKPTTTQEITSIFAWVKQGIHRLLPLNLLDDNGDTYADMDAFTNDIETVSEIQEVFEHNVVLLVNNWRQTQFFQVDDNGKNVVDNTSDGFMGQSGLNTSGVKNKSTYSYNLYDINIKSDKNLSQVSKIVSQIKKELEQYLDVFGEGY